MAVIFEKYTHNLTIGLHNHGASKNTDIIMLRRPMYYITATGKFLPNRFLANSPSTSSGLRGFKSLDLYNIRFTEYILCHFDHVSRGT